MKLVSEIRVEGSAIDLNNLGAEYRKATLNMAMATLSCEQALRSLPADVRKDQVAFIVATHFGEVTVTMEFLNTYYETQIPRPLLFQNSLHNSTLGFASIHLGLTGPAMTVSSDRETVPAAMDLAETLLEICPYVLVCFVDNIPLPLIPYYLENFPFLQEHLNQATCRLFARA